MVVHTGICRCLRWTSLYSALSFVRVKHGLLLGIVDGPGSMATNPLVLLEWLIGNPSEALLVGGGLVARVHLPVR